MSSSSVSSSPSPVSASASSTATSASLSRPSFQQSQTFSDPFPSSSSPSATSTSSGGASTDSGLNSSASLYLYTFLATLVLLLGVSAAIVFRSLILRRRHRAMIEEAIRNGTWIAPVSPRRVDPSMKPKTYEAFALSPEDHAAYNNHNNYNAGWEDFKPISLAYTVPYTSRSLSHPPAPAPPPVPFRQRARTFWNTYFLSTPPPFEPPAAQADTTVEPELPSPGSGPLQMAVLIAMPSPTPAHKHRAGEDLPHVEFGVAQLPLAGAHTQAEDAKSVGGGSASASL